jgi:hypothetical protein
MAPLQQEELDKRFDHHPPAGEDTVHRHEEVRRHCKALAYAIGQLVPEGREKSLALTHTEEVMFWANAGIARDQ